MCCGHEGHHGRHHRGSHHCGGHAHSGPCFWTKEEKIAWLEEYFENLQEKARAVEARIAALKAEA